jgi:hypothetical protein
VARTFVSVVAPLLHTRAPTMNVSGPSLVGGTALLLSSPMMFQLTGSMHNVGGTAWSHDCALAEAASTNEDTTSAKRTLRLISIPSDLPRRARNAPPA